MVSPILDQSMLDQPMSGQGQPRSDQHMWSLWAPSTLKTLSTTSAICKVVSTRHRLQICSTITWTLRIIRRLWGQLSSNHPSSTSQISHQWWTLGPRSMCPRLTSLESALPCPSADRIRAKSTNKRPLVPSPQTTSAHQKPSLPTLPSLALPSPTVWPTTSTHPRCSNKSRKFHQRPKCQRR